MAGCFSDVLVRVEQLYFGQNIVQLIRKCINDVNNRNHAFAIVKQGHDDAMISWFV